MNFWDERFASKAHFYGTEPNAFYAEQLATLPVGKALFVAEGQGRNALYAASKGWQVTATDLSSVAAEQTLEQAKALGLSIEYQVVNSAELNFPDATFDLIVFVFAHLPPALRRIVHQNAAQWLKPSGHIILEAFRPEQLAYTSGGPKEEDWLLTLDIIRQDFPTLTVQLLEAQNTFLNEGPHHTGEAAVVRFVGKKIG